MKITSLIDRFGSNRLNAEIPARLLSACTPKVTAINVAFAGGMCEVAHFADLPSMNIINVNDLDRHAMNLGRVIRHQRSALVEMLDATLFHPDSLAESQAFCRAVEKAPPGTIAGLEWAYHYFVCSWMTRGGKMGTRGEFEQGLSVRWKSTGGDSVTRFRNATEGLAEWSEVMRPCTFHTRDAFEFLCECKKRDVAENAIYCDPPWVDDGKNYTHGAFDELVNWSNESADMFAPSERITKHEALARMLSDFKNARIVVRYGDHPEVRRLYSADRWTWNMATGRTSANKDKQEVLLTNF